MTSIQFSVRTLLIATAAVAILFVLPDWLYRLVLPTFWYIVPAGLTMVALHGTSGPKSFAIGSLSTYVALTISHSNSFPYVYEYFWRIGTVVCAGYCGVLIRRRLVDAAAANQGD